MSEHEVVVVTGANSGIGRATALHLAQAGYLVVGTVRSLDRAGKLQTAAKEAGVEIGLVELDIADDSSVTSGFAKVIERYGQIDHLVNNAGVGGNGTVEESTSERMLEVLNVDLIGAIRCAQAVLPHMREHGSGTIVNVTSIAGRLAAIAQAPYVAAKWALEGISEELAQEVAPFGVRVAIIEPGVTKSSIFAKNTDLPNDTGAYGPAYEKMMQMYAAGYVHASDASEVAETIQHAIETDQPMLRYPVSWGGKEIVAGRLAMSDEDWVELGRVEDLDSYVAAFEASFGLDIST